MKGSYYCQACGWRGFFPNTLKKERMDKQGFNIISWVPYCPDCDKEVKFEPYK